MTAKIKMIIWSVPAAVIFFLLFMAVIPGGSIRYHSDLHHHDYFISQLSPEGRVDQGATSTAIKGEPAYFSLRTPRGFDKAKVSVNYIDDSRSPVIELGILTDKLVWNYDLEPMQNRIIDSLAGKWDAMTEGGTTLLQRKKEYDSISSFLSGMPELSRVATYDYDIKNDYRITGYEKSADETVSDVQLRGPFQLYVYIKDEKLDISFTVGDINANKDPDPVTINVYDSNNSIISMKRLEDDGIASDSWRTAPDRELRAAIDGLEEGAYKIEFKSNNDIITRSIRTRQSKISFINKVWIADAGRGDIRLYSDSRVFAAETINPNKLQTVDVGGSGLEIKETFKQFGTRTRKRFNEIRLEKDDVLVSGDGMFSFNPDSFINPTTKKINENSDIDGDGIDFIITGYAGPESSDGHKTATMEFDLSGAYRENGRYSFLISAPRLGTPSNPGTITIKDISVELSGKSLLDYIRSK